MNAGQRGWRYSRLTEVIVNRARPGVVTLVVELLAHRDNGVFHRPPGAIEGNGRSALAWGECGVATLAVKGDVTVHPGLRASGRGGDRTHRTPFNENRRDGILGQIHGHLRGEVSQKP